MSGFSDTELTCDRFLDGRVKLFQPRRGFRAGVDTVLLAAAVPALPGQSVLELGCGAGAAILCLGARVPELDLTGVEIQRAYSELARRNAAANGVALEVVCADLTRLPAAVRQRRFDHVIANPPYYRAGAHFSARDSGRSRALGEETALADWIDAASRRLAERGFLHVIQRVDRLPDLLAACQGRLGSLEVLPLSGRPGRAPDRMILRARKGGRAAFRLHAPVVLHDSPVHVGRADYTEAISAVLRDGAALSWPET